MARRYRKRPVEVEAMQWLGSNIEELQAWMGPANEPGGVPVQIAFDEFYERGVMLYVAANRSWLPIEVGEWVLKDGAGFYPCKASIFAETYEVVS